MASFGFSLTFPFLWRFCHQNPSFGLCLNNGAARTSFSLRASSSSSPPSSVSIASSSAPPTTQTHKLNKYSSRVTEPKSHGGSQAILLAVGLSDEDLLKPQIGICSVWYEGNTCNMHLLRLSEAVKEGVLKAGMVGFRNTCNMHLLRLFEAVKEGVLKAGVVGLYLLELQKMYLKPRDIITPKSLRNAMVIVMALGGSTNAVLHLIAIARSVGLELTLDDFQKVSYVVPFLADLKPSGKYVMEE